MLVEIGLAVICTLGVVFCLRFLMALKSEWNRRLSGYWVRIRFEAGGGKVAVSEERQGPDSRAA
jgi:hypothetical protein